MQLPIRSILVFHAAARSCSISKAADELSVTPSAVTQQIQSLELQLGVTLVNKMGRGIVLTEAGERYFEMITDQIERISDATNTIRGHRTVTTLNIRATPTVSNKWLLPRLKSFLDQHPEIDLRLDGTNEPTDFNRDLVDVEIRHGDGRWPGLFVEGLVEESFIPVCSPHLAGLASLKPEDVTKFRLVHSVKSQVQWPRWLKEAGVTHEFRWQRVLFDRSHMAIDAASDGLGIALESELMMWRELSDGRLICPVASPHHIALTTQWIVCPRDHLRHRKVKIFLDWIRAARDDWREQSGSRPWIADRQQ